MDQTEEIEVLHHEHDYVSASGEQDQLTGGEARGRLLQQLREGAFDGIGEEELQALLRAIGRYRTGATDGTGLSSPVSGSSAPVKRRDCATAYARAADMEDRTAGDEATRGGHPSSQAHECDPSQTACLTETGDDGEAQGGVGEGADEGDVKVGGPTPEDSGGLLAQTTQSMEPAQYIMLLSGIPGSGKSTWARNAVRANENWKRVNRDELRKMLYCEQFNPKFEEMLTIVERNCVGALIVQGYNVIVDATHCKPKYLREWCEFVNQNLPSKVQVLVRRFDTPIEVCLARNAERPEGERVPEWVIKRMFMSFQGMKL